MDNESCCYILDANVIRMLSFEQLKEASEKGFSIVTIEEVNYEVQSLEKAKIIRVKSLNYDAFEKMREIINNSSNVRKIISYYENKGAADVALLAYALTSNNGHLFGDENIIVSNDNGLRIACDELKVKWISMIDFLAIT